MMKLIRSAAGKNDFAITGLSLGKVIAIRHTLSNSELLSPVASDVHIFLNRENLDKIDPCGDSHTDVTLHDKLSEYTEELARKESGQVPAWNIVEDLRKILEG